MAQGANHAHTAAAGNENPMGLQLRKLGEVTNRRAKEVDEQTVVNLGQTDGVISVLLRVECGTVRVLFRHSCDVTTKVGDLKKMLETQMKIPAYFQAWYLDDQELWNTDTLGGRNVRANRDIRVVELYSVRE